MAGLKCVLARLSENIPSPEFSGGAQGLADLYRTSSGDAIELDVDTAFLEQPLEQFTTSHYSLDLHYAVRQLTGNPIDKPFVGAIAVMFGGFYRHFPEVFGVMFDRGFIPAEQDDLESRPDIVGRPREGCAIFLGEIGRRRSDPVAYARQVEFSTIHEMGHLFNLLHLQQPRNFLSTSDPYSTYSDKAFHFEPPHLEQLTHAVGNPNVWPGGSNFEDLGPDAHFDTSRRPPNAARRRNDNTRAAPRRFLTMRLAVGRDHFRYFEPIELDISIRLSRKAPGRVRLPRTIDPGYSTFRLWIEEPSGERRLYRSPRLYCEHGLTMTLKPGETFRRDISVFGQSGGYTFRRVGIHRIWAELTLGGGQVLRSNVLEIDLEQPKLSSVGYRVAHALRTPAVAEVLYHRLDRYSGVGLRALEAVLDESHRLPIAPSLQYTLGRTYLSDPNVSTEAAARAREHLAYAIDSPEIGLHQREKALALLHR